MPCFFTLVSFQAIENSQKNYSDKSIEIRDNDFTENIEMIDEMIRLMYVSFRKPYPLSDGSALRTYNICKRFKDRGNKVFLSHFSHQGEQANSEDSILKLIAEEIFPLNIPGFYNKIYGKLYQLFLSVYHYPRIIFKPKSISTIQANFKKIIETYGIDVIHVKDLQTGLFLINFHEIPKVLDFTDSTSLAVKREIREEKCFVKKIRNYLLYYWIKGIEKTLLKDSNIVTVVSPIDKEILKKCYKNARVEVIPNGVDTNYFSPKVGEKEEYPSILFHGTMNFPPNIRAIKYIYDDIFPIIRSQIPETKFWIVGSSPVDEIEQLGRREGVMVTGHVNDIREYISKASVVLVPMKSGSGIKNKILEAMAMEKPVVTNPMGAEALSEKAKNCLLIGETADEIASHVIDLLRDREKRVELGKKGREIVMREYTWDRVVDNYGKLYRDLIKNMNGKQ